MSQKSMILFGMIVGSFVGGFIPSLWGAGALSFSGLFTSGAGAILGIWVAYRMTK